MGNVATVGARRFPAQGRYLGSRCAVVFDYDTSTQFRGTIVRDDFEEPWRTIIQLDKGPYILGTECQYRPCSESEWRYLARWRGQANLDRATYRVGGSPSTEERDEP